MASGERGRVFGSRTKRFFRRVFGSRHVDARVEAQSAATTSTHEHNLASVALQTPTNPNFASTDEQPNKVASASAPELQQAGGELQASPCNANASSGHFELKEQEKVKEKVKQLTAADVDALLHYIEAELQRLDPSPPAATATSVKTVLLECQNQKDNASCFVKLLSQDVTKEVIGAGESIFLSLLKDTLGVMGGVHWAGLGLSLIAWSLDNMDRTSQNHENCLKLLRKVVSLLSNISISIGLKDIENDPRCIQALEGSTELALRCAIVCSSSLNEDVLRRFFKAAKVEQVISAMEKELEEAKVTNLIVELRATRIEVTKMGVGVDAINKKMPKAHGSITFSSYIEDMVGGVAEVQKIVDYLNKDCGELVAVCLHGMGGIGKSERAFSIYQKFAEMKEKRYHCCMMELDFEAKKVDVVTIQWQILQKICSDVVAEFSNVKEGKEKMIKELAKIRGPIFLYLDNLLDAEHLPQLVPASKYFPTGSKLLITTRNKNVFYKLQKLDGIKHCECFEIEKLLIDEARELFFKEIGRNSVGNREKSTALEKLEDEVLKLCDGLPLALIVVSSFIANSEQNAMDLALWKEVAEAMKRAIPLSAEVDDDKLYSCLNFSIDRLSKHHKGAFLDIVVFAAGKRWEYVERLVGKTVLEELFHRSLIKKGTTKKLKLYDSAAVVEIHDVLYAIGKKMAKDDPCDIRITCEEDFRQNAGSLQRIVGLSKITLSQADLIGKMPRLRVLHDAEINVECEETQFPDLKAIKIRSSVPRPIHFNACSGLRQLSWRHDNADMELWELAECSTSLEVLKLAKCRSLQVLPKEIGSLTSLEVLKLAGCRRLQVLPKEIGSLRSLQVLNLAQCRILQSLPEEIGSLTSLQVLNLAECRYLQVLPKEIGSLTSLQVLNLDQCKDLQVLPEEIGSLTSLQVLQLSGCRRLQSLPEIAHLTSLIELNLHACGALKSLPEGIACLSSLRVLDLFLCYSLESLPQGIVSLTALDLTHCRRLETLPEGLMIPSSWSEGVEAVKLYGCESLKRLPDGAISSPSLRKLSFDRCRSLESLPKGICSSLTSLEVLELSGCVSLKSLPEEIANWSRLQELYLYGCENLESLPQALTSLTALRTLNLRGCGQLRSFPNGMAGLTALQTLNIFLCWKGLVPLAQASLPRCNIISTRGIDE